MSTSTSWILYKHSIKFPMGLDKKTSHEIDWESVSLAKRMVEWEEANSMHQWL